MEKVFKNYSLSIVLAILFLGSWTLQGVFQWQAFVKEEQEHGQEATLSDFQPEFLASTFENWQSEFLQLLSFVTLTTFLIHKGSPESKDGDEEMQKTLKKIDKKLDRRKKGRG